MKKEKLLKAILILAMICPGLAVAQTAELPSGAGTALDPYQVNTLNNLFWITQNIASWGKYFVQTANIDASTTSTWDGGAGFSPIGTSSNPFYGFYNGQNFIINGLTINRPSWSYIGLFGYLDMLTPIENLGLTNVNITGKNFVGGLVGQVQDYSTINNSYCTGSVIAGTYVGGLVGINNSDCYINNSYSTSNVTGTTAVGGLVGQNYSYSTVDGCFSNGYVTGGTFAGGLAGNNAATSTLIDSYSTGNVTGTDKIGGLLGRNYSSSVSRCYSTGNVSGNSMVGGLSGDNNTSTVSNRYCRGNVIRLSGGTGDNIGGFLGNNSSTIEYCYSTGSVTYENSENPTDKGFVGTNNSGIYTNNFWDSEASNQTTALGATAKNTAEMKTRTTFLNAGWNPTIWYMDAGFNDGYPYLSWQNPDGTPIGPFAIQPSGSGTAEDPYQVANLSNLYWITQNNSSWNKYFVQTADFNSSPSSTWNNSAGFSPIGNFAKPFSGTYNGQGHTINGLYINSGSGQFLGLFGYTNFAVIQNLGVTNVNITGGYNTGGLVGCNNYTTVSNCYCTGNVYGNYDYIGGLMGINYHATVNNCYSTGDVNGRNSVGGLVGAGQTSATLSNSYSTCIVTGSSYTGGLVGVNITSSTVSNCYSTGNVSGTDAVGGIVGWNTDNSTMNNCYSHSDVTRMSGATGTNFGGFCGVNNSSAIEYCCSTGSVTYSNSSNPSDKGFVGSDATATYTSNFWDSEESNQTTATGATAKTTAEMKTESTFTDAGWDFVGETTNGTNDYWDIDPTQTINTGYPFLSWQDTYAVWNGSQNNEWNNPDNWSGGPGVPTSVKNVIIPDVANDPVISTAAEAATLTIQNGGTLTIAGGGSLTVNGTTITDAGGNTGLIILTKCKMQNAK